MTRSSAVESVRSRHTLMLTITIGVYASPLPAQDATTPSEDRLQQRSKILLHQVLLWFRKKVIALDRSKIVRLLPLPWNPAVPLSNYRQSRNTHEARTVLVCALLKLPPYQRWCLPSAPVPPSVAGINASRLEIIGACFFQLPAHFRSVTPYEPLLSRQTTSPVSMLPRLLR